MTACVFTGVSFSASHRPNSLRSGTGGPGSRLSVPRGLTPAEDIQINRRQGRSCTRMHAGEASIASVNQPGGRTTSAPDANWSGDVGRSSDTPHDSTPGKHPGTRAAPTITRVSKYNGPTRWQQFEFRSSAGWLPWQQNAFRSSPGVPAGSQTSFGVMISKRDSRSAV